MDGYAVAICSFSILILMCPFSFVMFHIHSTCIYTHNTHTQELNRSSYSSRRRASAALTLPSQLPPLVLIDALQRTRKEYTKEINVLLGVLPRGNLNTPEADTLLRSALAALEMKAGQPLYPLSFISRSRLALVLLSATLQRNLHSHAATESTDHMHFHFCTS